MITDKANAARISLCFPRYAMKRHFVLVIGRVQGILSQTLRTMHNKDFTNSSDVGIKCVSLALAEIRKISVIMIVSLTIMYVISLYFITLFVPWICPIACAIQSYEVNWCMGKQLQVKFEGAFIFTLTRHVKDKALTQPCVRKFGPRVQQAFHLTMRCTTSTMTQVYEGFHSQSKLKMLRIVKDYFDEKFRPTPSSHIPGCHRAMLRAMLNFSVKGKFNPKRQLLRKKAEKSEKRKLMKN